MMSEWKEIGLSDITSKIGDGLHGTPKYNDDGDYYFINGNNLLKGKIVIKPDTKTVSEDEYIKYKKELSNSSILISINGTIGNVALYNSEKCMLGKSACYININENADRSYIYYEFLNRNFQSYIRECATGTTIPNVPLKGIREYRFNLPPLKEQRAIAEVLSSLDDKIDLLHRQNKTLETLAETLFRQTFIEQADENWEERKLEEFFPVITGKKDANYANEMGVYPFFTCSQNQTLFSDSYSFEGDAILLSGNGDFNVKWYRGRFEAYQRTYVLIPYEPKILPVLHILLKISLNELTSGFRGSVINYLTKSMITDFCFQLPCNNLLLELSRDFLDIYAKIETNQIQIQTLEKLRDTLLPKLMSGKVRIKI